MNEHDPPILLFDGLCNLCDATVQFVIDRDPAERIVFASLQSNVGRALAESYGVVTRSEPDSVVLIEDGAAYERSSAVLRVARHLTWPWKALVVLLAMPRFARDYAYRFVARRRYAWFGKSEACRVPTPALRRRFLEARPELVPGVPPTLRPGAP
jgi:predicted DCC family thiol-disulfide oxidoreductase YuxK